jgi:glycine/D-amino acid oxidase-like deaminating enzyme
VANGIERDTDGKVVGLKLSNAETLPCDALVIAAGPWSGPMVEDLFDVPLPMEGIKSTSLVFNDCTPVQTEAFACFCEEDSNGCHLGTCMRFISPYL